MAADTSVKEGGGGPGDDVCNTCMYKELHSLHATPSILPLFLAPCRCERDTLGGLAWPIRNELSQHHVSL